MCIIYIYIYIKAKIKKTPLISVNNNILAKSQKKHRNDKEGTFLSAELKGSHENTEEGSSNREYLRGGLSDSTGKIAAAASTDKEDTENGH